MTVQDNARRITDLEADVKTRVLESTCEPRMGRVMDAVDRLRDTTKDLSDAIAAMKADAAKDKRASRATLVAAIVTAVFVVVGLILNHMTKS